MDFEAKTRELDDAKFTLVANSFQTVKLIRTNVLHFNKNVFIWRQNSVSCVLDLKVFEKKKNVKLFMHSHLSVRFPVFGGR